MPRLKNAQILLSQVNQAPEQKPERLKKTFPASKKTPREQAELPIADTLEPNKELEKTVVPDDKLTPPEKREKREKTDGNGN